MLVVFFLSGKNGREVANVKEWKSGELSKLGKWVVGIWCGEVLRDIQSVQICQKKINVHENGHDKWHKYVEMWGQENDNQDKRSYCLKTHMKGTYFLGQENQTSKRVGIDTKSKDTQIYTENHNQEYDEKDTQI